MIQNKSCGCSCQPNHDPFHQCLQVVIPKRYKVRSLECWQYPFHLAEASTITRSIASYICRGFEASRCRRHMVKTLDLKDESHVNILFILTQNVSSIDILGQYNVELLQYAFYILQYIVMPFWHIVTALLIFK